MRQLFEVVIQWGANGDYVASVTQLPGCHTQARSLEELEVRIREAIQCYTGSDEDVELIVTPISEA